MTELWQLTALELAHRFGAGLTSPSDAVDAAFKRISEVDSSIGAFRCVMEEVARAEAAERTDELSRGHRRGPLHGIPVAVKELFDVTGAPADYGSDALAGRVADTDAQLVTRLRRAGAVIVGTTISHEFGWGITTQHRTRGGTRNPWDLDRVPGGSSGGSAAAVATGMVPIAVASDTGGSIRIPAAFCGVAGLKPTYGLVGRTGGVPLAPSFDTPGALGRSMDDVALLVSAMSGLDPGDPGCAGRLFTAETFRSSSLAGRRIGVADAMTDTGLDAGVRPVYEQAVATIEDLGAELVALDLPSASSALEAFVPLQMAEAHDVHHRLLGTFPGRRDHYGDDVRARLDAAAEVSVSQYLAANEGRLRLVAAFRRGLATVDAVVSPISAVAPPPTGSSDEATFNGERRPLREVVMPFTVPQNLAGLPTAIVRAGFDGGGLPVGLQITAGRWCEATAVAIASTLQFALGPIGTVLGPDSAHGG